MTLRDDVKTKIQQQWPDFKAKLQERYEDLTDDDLSTGEDDPEGVAERLATSLGDSIEGVEMEMTNIASQLPDEPPQKASKSRKSTKKK